VELQNYLGLTSSSDNELLNGFLLASQQMIDAETGRTFEAAGDSTRYFDAVMDVEGATLYLGNYDLCAITTITNGDGGSITGSHHVTEPRNTTPYYAIKLKASSGKSWTYSTDPENAISVTGRWAYSTIAPASIVQACKRLAAYLYRQKDNAGDLDRALVVGNSTILPGQIPADIHALLRPYRRITL
jgi:hypothetical protein